MPVLFNCCENKPVTITKTPPDVFKQCERLGRGGNFGDILYKDGHFGHIIYRNPDWDKEKEKKELGLMKDIGMRHVRICIAPFGSADENSSYTLTKDFFERLDWTIHTALSDSLAVIIDQHEFNAMAEDPMAKKEMFLLTWKQIAEHYKDYPNQVYFGVLNEPNGNLTPYLWNYFCADAIKIIRASNPYRTLLVGPGTWNNIESLQYLKLPENDRNIIVEFHYYKPYHFTHQGAEWDSQSGAWMGTTWRGTPEEKQAVLDDFNMVVDWGKNNNRPMYLGEFGVLNHADTESRAQWLSFIVHEAEINNIPWARWDLIGPYFGIYDPSKGTWIVPLKDAILTQSH